MTNLTILKATDDGNVISEKTGITSLESVSLIDVQQWVGENLCSIRISMIK